MNISKIKTTTVMTFAACTLLACFSASAQDEAKTSSVFEELETQKFTFEKAATPPVLNLSAAVNPFGDLQLSLLSVSHSDFEELRNLIATDASLSTAPKPHTVGVQKYQLTRKQVEYLDEHVRPLVEGQQAQPFHTYRIARSDADFLFGQLPVAGGFPVQGRVRLHESPDYRIEPSDVLLIESALKFRSPHAAIVIGESLMVRVNRSTRSAKDESAFSRPIINGECTVGTDGYLDLGPEYGKVHVAGQPLSEIQRRVEIHLKRKLKTSQVLVSLPGVKPKQQVKGQHLVQPDGTVALGVYGDVAVAGMTLQKARQAIGRHLQHQIQDHQLHVDVLGNNRDIYYVISDSGGANEQIYTLPSTGDETVRDAIAQIKGLASAAGVQEIWIERPKPNGRGAHQVLNVGWDEISKGPQQLTNYEILPGDRLCVGTRFVAALKFETDRTRNGNRLLAGQFRLKATPDKPIDVEFSLQPQEGAGSPISQMIAIPAGERVWLLTSAAKRTKQIRPNPTCTCKASIIEFSGKAMAELQELLSVTATASPAWVISDNDLSSLAEFADAQVEVGSARLLSTPMVSAAPGKPMRLTPDSPVSVAAGDGATVVEFDSIGVSLHATVTPVGSLSNRLEWLFGNTDRDANWSSVTRHTKGSAVVKADESILVPLPIRNDGIHVVAVLKASRAANNENQSVINEPENSDQQFAELTKNFNQLMTARRHAEAILVAEKAVELQPDNRAAIVMVEKAKLQAQIARIENGGDVSNENGGGLGSVVAVEPPAIHAGNSDSEVAAETSSSSDSPKINATSTKLRTLTTDRSVRCDVGNAVRLQHSSRIKALSGFDSAIVKVEPIQGDPSSVTVYALAEGGTQIRIVDEHDAEHLVNVLSLQFSGLDVYLKHFFPAVDVEVWPIRSSVLLRGIVGSELQKQHIIAVAELFYPQILDQLTVDASAASEAVKTDRHVPVGGELTDQSAITITAARSSLIVPRSVARTLVFSNRIRSVDVFNSKSIKVELAQGTANRFLVNGLASGTSRLTVVDEDDQEFFVNIVVEDNVQELRFLASRLYPDLGLNFHSVKGSILVRGTVESEIQAQQVIDLAEQFSGHVLNHTQVVANSTATNLQERQTIITSDGIRTVRSDIKSLHRDVRSLIEILKTRKSVNAAAREQATE